MSFKKETRDLIKKFINKMSNFSTNLYNTTDSNFACLLVDWSSCVYTFVILTKLAFFQTQN